MKRRILSIITALALCLSLCPTWALAVAADPSLCKHHQSHTAECGYTAPTEGQPCGHEHTEDCYTTDEADGEVLDCQHSHDSACGYVQADPGAPCGYVCHICPIEALIVALPEQVTEDNADDVRAQLDHILDLYRELNEDEQGQLDLSRIYALQGALDAANAPITADGHTEQQDTDEASVTINGETLYYATLEEAFAAADGQTATITMLKDAQCIRGGSTNRLLDISSGKVALDMNGKTLSGKGYGDKGIIDVSGGSLSIHGKGAFTVIGTVTAISCNNNGILIISETTFNFTHDFFYPASGIVNNGGTVIINSGIFSGEVQSTYGQILHKSGNTTINYAETTGTTTEHPVGVHYKSGALTISGGTFSNITVEVGGEIKNVAELLGEGCAYKKQDGTWATADDLAAMEISNVTVAKIPLTIHPQGDTSWYYSTHTLAMNAAPVDSGNSVSYVWKSGEETLDCTSDAYTVPADTPVGSYTYTCEATCDGYTLSHTFTFKIEKSGTDLTSEGKVKTYNGDTLTTSFSAGDTITVKATPTPTGEAPANSAMFAASFTGPGAGQMAVFVGDTQVSVPADKGEDGSYTMTVPAADVLLAAGGPGTGITLTAKFIGNDSMADGEGTATVNITAVARVEKDGITSYVDKNGLLNAFDIDNGNNGAVITLLEDVELTGNSCISIQIDCTLDFGGHTILADATAVSYAVLVPEGKTVTIRGAGGISGINNSQALQIGGNVTLEGGTFSCAAGSCVSVVSNSASLSVTSPNVRIENTAGRGLRVGLAQSVQLSAGTYSGTTEAITFGTNCSLTLTDLLADGHAYHSGNTPIPLQPDGKELTGTVTVKECNHTGGLVPSENGYQHGGPCKCCGAELTTANHTVGADNQCSGCGAELVAKVEKSGSDTVYVEASGLADVFAEDSGNDGATITLLDNITTSKQINVYTDNLTLDLNGKTYTCTQNAFQIFFVSLTIKGSGAITTSGFYCLVVDEGTLNIESGSFSAKESAVYVVSGGTLQLTSGTFTGGQNAIAYAGSEVTEALANYGVADAPHYAFYQDSSPYTPSGSRLPSGTFTVQECQHTGVEVKDLGSGKHGLTCPYCGYHSEHTTTLTATVSGNNVTLNGGCGTEGCNYAAELGTVSFTFENLVYGNPDAKVSWIKGGPTALGVMLKIDNALNYVVQSEEATHSCSLTNPNAEAGTPVTAKPHTMKVSFYDDGSIIGTKTVECELTFTVAPAPLTPSITGTATKPYDGTTDAPAGLAITLTGVVGSDDVTATASYAYDTANAGTNKTITASGITLEGDGKDNYRKSYGNDGLDA